MLSSGHTISDQKKPAHNWESTITIHDIITNQKKSSLMPQTSLWIKKTQKWLGGELVFFFILIFEVATATLIGNGVLEHLHPCAAR